MAERITPLSAILDPPFSAYWYFYWFWSCLATLPSRFIKQQWHCSRLSIQFSKQFNCQSNRNRNWREIPISAFHCCCCCWCCWCCCCCCCCCPTPWSWGPFFFLLQSVDSFSLMWLKSLRAVDVDIWCCWFIFLVFPSILLYLCRPSFGSGMVSYCTWYHLFSFGPLLGFYLLDSKTCQYSSDESDIFHFFFRRKTEFLSSFINIFRWKLTW